MLSGRILLVAFEGWNDATEGASNALRAISDQIQAQTLDAVDPEDYFDFQLARPMLELDPDGGRIINWPGCELLQASVEQIEKQPELANLFILLGTEPSRRWLSFTAEILDMIEDREIDQVIMLGAMLAEAPHSRPMQLHRSSQNPAIQALFGLEPSKYEGPIGIMTVLSQALEAEGIPVLSLWGSVPHYVHNTTNPKAALAFLTELSIITSFEFDTKELADLAFEWERSIDEMSQSDDELSTYIEQLEKTRDEQDSEEVSGDALAREFERYLRQRPDGSPDRP